MSTKFVSVTLLLSLCGCVQQQDYLFFDNEYLNEQLRVFIDTTKTDNGNKTYYQVIVGQNKKGVKVDFIATNLFLGEPLYFSDPIKLFYVGNAEMDSSLVSVYVCEGDKHKQLLNYKMIHHGKIMHDNEPLCTVRPIILSFQIDANRQVTHICPVGSDQISYYYLQQNHSPDSCTRMAIYANPNICEVIAPLGIASGTWIEEQDSVLFISFDSFRCYSKARNEMVECDAYYISTIIDRNISEILSTRRYNRNNNYLLPQDTGIDFLWVRDRAK